MAERLIIKNFGPIKSVELELRRFNILIGEQATGKSTVAKVLSVCRYFSYLIDRNPLGEAFIEGLFAWGLGEFIQEDSLIQYECNHYYFSAERTRRERLGVDKYENSFREELLAFKTSLEPKSQEFHNLLTELDRIIPHPMEVLNSVVTPAIPNSFFQNDVARVMDNPFYLPAERGLQSVFSLGKTSIQNISDSLFNQWAKMYQIARYFKDDTPIEPLKIIYKNENGRGLVKKVDENEFYTIINAATGYQSTVPIVLMTKYYCEIRKRRKTFIIEEPEQNLFPTAQYDLVQHLVDKTMNYGNSILITTHSPYILTSLNNLLYAHRVGQVDGVKVDSIIKKDYWLNQDEISIYMLSSDGECKDIFDKNIGMFQVEKIDEVSNKINKQWDKLTEIESARKL